MSKLQNILTTKVHFLYFLVGPKIFFSNSFRMGLTLIKAHEQQYTTDVTVNTLVIKSKTATIGKIWSIFRSLQFPMNSPTLL